MRYLLACALTMAVAACATPSATTAPGAVVRPVSTDFVIDLAAKADAATKRREVMERLYGNEPNTVHLVTAARIDEVVAGAAFKQRLDVARKEPLLIGLTFSEPIRTLEDSDLCPRDNLCIAKAARTVLHTPTQASIVLPGDVSPGIYDVVLRYTYSQGTLTQPVTGQTKISFVLK